MQVDSKQLMGLICSSLAIGCTGMNDTVESDFQQELLNSASGETAKADSVERSQIYQMCVYDALDLAVIIRRHVTVPNPGPFDPGGPTKVRFDGEVWQRNPDGSVVMTDLFEDVREGSPQSTNRSGYFYSRDADFYRHATFNFGWNGGFERVCQPGPGYGPPVCNRGEPFLTGTLKTGSSFLFEDIDLLELNATCESY